MKIKSFVITSMSIIVGIFISLLRERKLIPMIEWKEGKHNHISIDNNTEVVIYKKKKVVKYEKKLTLDEAISLIESNNIINIIPSSYPVLRILRDLQNKIHLDKATKCLESDYVCFNEEIYNTTKLLLFEILKLKVASNDINYATFLRK